MVLVLHLILLPELSRTPTEGNYQGEYTAILSVKFGRLWPPIDKPTINCNTLLHLVLFVLFCFVLMF